MKINKLFLGILFCYMFEVTGSKVVQETLFSEHELQLIKYSIEQNPNAILEPYVVFDNLTKRSFHFHSKEQAEECFNFRKGLSESQRKAARLFQNLEYVAMGTPQSSTDSDLEL